jgi:heme/copper-type cytochrome/quinol oxidase subunit 3
MKTKNKKPFLQMDERNKLIAYKVATIMYLLTILAMQGIVIYRQFALGQDISDFEDIAIIMTINSLFLISALLYFGAIQIRRLKIKSILLIYIIMVILGSIFTYVKYNVFQSPGLTTEQLLHKLIIIASIIGIILGCWILLSLLGKKRIEKELES